MLCSPQGEWAISKAPCLLKGSAPRHHFHQEECEKQFQGRNIVSPHMVCIQLQLQSCLASSPEHCYCQGYTMHACTGDRCTQGG